MAAVSLLLIVCLKLGYFMPVANCAATNNREICYQGYSDADSGGSCTFNKGHLCDWESTGFQTKWEVNKNKEAFADMQGKNQGSRAILTSPWMCEDNFTTICVQFYFMFNDPDGGRLTLKLCHDDRTCDDLWFTNSRDINEWSWYQVNKTVTLTQRRKFQIQFQGEKITDTWFRETDFYLNNIIYKNTSCNYKPPVVHYSSTRYPFLTTFRKFSTVFILGAHQTTETVLGVESSHDVVDSAVSTGIAAAVVAFVMIIAAVVVVVRYYINNRFSCNRTLFRGKRSARRQIEKNPPIAASNQLYNMVGFNPNSNSGCCHEIQSIRQLPAAEPEVNIYSDVEFMDTTLPRRNQGSLMASANPYWVSDRVQTSSLVAMTSSMQSEATGETIYQNTDTKDHPGKELGQDSSYLTPCAAEMKMEKMYQNMDTSL